MHTSVKISLPIMCLFLYGCITQPVVGPLANKNDLDAGTLRLHNGKTFRILPAQLEYSGNAEYQYPDGSIYQGDFYNGRRQGQGQQKIAPAEVYKGGWYNDKRNGQGALFKANRSTYMGGFRDNKKSGFGIQTNPRGRYEGDWREDTPHGYGHLSEANGIDYQGAWESGQRSGYGIAYSRAGTIYEGLWANNKRDGYGKETGINGGEYTGEWLNNQRHGEGRATLLDGNSHTGAWEYNIPLGPGTNTDSSGIQITGIWTGNTVRAGILQLPGQFSDPLADKESFAGALYSAHKENINPGLLAWLDTQAHTGNAYAQLMLAKAYADYKKPQQDLSKAVYWFDKAAEQNLLEAKYRLALFYLQLPDHYQQGLALLNFAVENKHADSALKLGNLYQMGEGLPRNLKVAMQHYEIASDQGNLVARNNLAWLLATTADAELRNGAQALKLAEPMAYLFDTWGYLDTLAAALAETGDFEKAVSVQKKALERAKPVVKPVIYKQISRRLEQYQAHKPFHSTRKSPE